MNIPRGINDHSLLTRRPEQRAAAICDVTICALTQRIEGFNAWRTIGDTKIPFAIGNEREFAFRVRWPVEG
jgi:hypothetical protein